jgi:hypothetical protein
MFHRHCWHKVEGTEIKEKRNKQCRRNEDEVYYSIGDFSSGWGFSLEEECCICGKIRRRSYLTSNKEKWDSYPK